MKENELQISKEQMMAMLESAGGKPIEDPNKPEEEPHYEISRESYYQRLIQARDMWVSQWEHLNEQQHVLNTKFIECQKNLLNIQRMFEEPRQAEGLNLKVKYMYDPNKVMIYTLFGEKKGMGFIPHEGNKDIDQE